MSENNTPVKRLDSGRFLRDYGQERALHIEDISFYAYEECGDIHIIGEIFAKKISMPFYLTCALYDEDGDMITSEENLCYGSGLVTNIIKPEAFFNGFPFEFCISVPETPIAHVKITPVKC